MKIFKITLCISLFSFIINASLAQQNESIQISKIILKQDSLFWQSYNECDVEKMKSFLTDDLEFYHDKGGLTVGLEPFIESVKNGLCGQEGWHLRREAVAGSVKVFPLANYGAIISGEHVFYINEKDRPEYLDGQALFTHVWLLKEDQWKMARVLSYNHHPATYKSQKKEIIVAAKIISSYQGTYDGTNIKNIVVSIDNNKLNIRTGDMVFLPLAESDNKFFLEERDLQFEFVKDAKGKVSKMIVWEKSNKVEEAIKVR